MHCTSLFGLQAEKVENARHPSKLVANAVSEGQEAYVSYVKNPVGRGVLLGLQAGLV